MRSQRPLTASLVAAFTAVGIGAATSLAGVCGPFTDVAADAFCPFVLEIFTLGITTGTTATTFSPGDNVTRLQMAAFLSRTVDRVLARGGRRAAGDLFWTPRSAASVPLTTIASLTTFGSGSDGVASDGADLWVANNTDDTVSRVRASDGKLLETWTGATSAVAVLAGPMGSVFVAGASGGSTGQLYRINPAQPAGAVTTVATTEFPSGAMAFDGARIWTTNSSSVSIITPGPVTPWTTTTGTFVGGVSPAGMVWDGSNIWITDSSAGTLLRLDSGASVLQTITVGSGPVEAVFDGTSIWVPNGLSNSVSVVRAATGGILATLTGNGLNTPFAAAFDGERILVTQYFGYAVSLWKAADLTPLGTVPIGPGSLPRGACSDGLNFWVVLTGYSALARF